MIVRNLDKIEIQLAIKNLNKKYNGYIRIDRLDKIRKNIEVYNLKIKMRPKAEREAGDNKGVRISPYSGRLTAACCWHVYGHLFEELLNINDSAIIETAPFGNTGAKKITKDGGNWQEWSEGTPYYGMTPVSGSCGCE